MSSDFTFGILGGSFLYEYIISSFTVPAAPINKISDVMRDEEIARFVDRKRVRGKRMLFLNLGRIGQGVNPFTDPDLKEYNGLMEYQISTNPFHDFHELIKAGN